GSPIDLTGAEVKVHTPSTLVYTFGSFVLQPEEAVVIFSTLGGGCTAPHGSRFFEADASFNLDGGADEVLVNSATSTTLDFELWFGGLGNAGQSMNQSPELSDSGSLVQHTTVAAANQSPGTYADGTPFGSFVFVHEVRTAGTEDLNCDGSVNDGDDFIELYNPTRNTVDLSGATIRDTTALRHTFDPGTLVPPGEAIVVFATASTCPVPSGAQFVAASTGSLSFDNSDQALVVKNSRTMDFENWTFATAGQGASITEPVQRTETGLDRHDNISTFLASPGTLADGTWFDGSGPLVINEVLANVSDDVNCDGTADSGQDEFVEIVNFGSNPVDLSGMTVHDATALRHTFAPGTLLGPNEGFVLWGGGNPLCSMPTNVLEDLASSGGLGLNNTGDTVTLQAADGGVVDSITFSATTANVSANRNPELDPTGAVVDHTTLSALENSPGYLSDVSEF
ncbi:MAG: lamin tail domain-containing protein, partial [Myxococcales bacterium]|nr:lamin tail domain-containing protein [Myxococcales bacterium]